MVNKILRSKLKNHVDKLLEMTKFAVSMEAYTYVKDKHFSSIQPWNIEYLKLRITFGMSRYGWPHPYEWT